MPYPTCQHIKTNGILCGSPALNRKLYCYFHNRLATRHRLYRNHSATATKTIELDPIADRHDLQMSLSQIINAVAVGQCDSKRAILLFKGLQLASSNLTALERLAESGQTLDDDAVLPPGRASLKEIRS